MKDLENKNSEKKKDENLENEELLNSEMTEVEGGADIASGWCDACTAACTSGGTF